jgi:hypothetical protein
VHIWTGIFLVERHVGVSRHDDGHGCPRYLPDFQAGAIQAIVGRSEGTLE